MTKRVVYGYDVFDRRVTKDVDANGDGVYETGQRFVYDGADIVLVFDNTGSLTNRYLHGPAVDQVFADERALEGILWNLPDNQGTVRDIVTSEGEVVNHLQYNAFGQIQSQSNPAIAPLFTYTGREWDPDANLYYYRARWYDPVLGRFISQDPLGFAAGDTNVQRYVGNGPVNGTDPSGEVMVTTWEEQQRRYNELLAEVFADGKIGPWESFLLLCHDNPDMLMPGGLTIVRGGPVSAIAKASLPIKTGPSSALIPKVPVHPAAPPPLIGRGVTPLSARPPGVKVTAPSPKQLLGANGKPINSPPPQPRVILDANGNPVAIVPRSVFGKSIPDLSKAGGIPDRGGLTAAGRSLTKHGAGARPRNSLFPPATGNPTQINAKAQTIVDDILNNAGTTFSKGFRGRFGDTIEAVAPDGRGIVFDMNGKFLFFKE